jgi:hypothetical protein
MQKKNVKKTVQAKLNKPMQKAESSNRSSGRSLNRNLNLKSDEQFFGGSTEKPKRGKTLGRVILIKLKSGFKALRFKFNRKVASRKIPGAPKSFKLSKLRKNPRAEKTTKIIADSFRFLGKNWKTFLIILLVYIGAYFVLAYATPNINLPDLLKEAGEAGSKPGVFDKLKVMTGALFTYRENASSFARWAQFFLGIIFSLIFIYAIRNLHKGVKLRARDALYAGTGNLIPFFLNLSLFAIQLIPLTFVAVVYNIGMNRELFINNLEKFTATGFLIGAALLTLWFLPTAIISLYAITLPGVYPLKTMQAVRIMVSRHRLEVVKDLLIFLLFIFVSYIILLALLVTYLPRFVGLSLDLFFLIALPLIHVMMYKLYLKLLESANEKKVALAK